MSGVLRWEEPPTGDEPGRRNGPRVADWYLIAAQLRGRPGEWAAVAESVHSTTAAHLREGKYVAFRPAGTFDTKCVRVNGLLTLYARYIGEES